MIKATMLAVTLLSAACTQILPTPNDFPSPAATIIVEFPRDTAMPTFAARVRSVPVLSDDMENARTFFLVTKVAAATGDDRQIAERILYPLQVRINGQRAVISSATEFLENYSKIFNAATLEALSPTDEQDLEVLPDGIRVGNGVLWFNLFCMDAACTQPEFLITQINN